MSHTICVFATIACALVNGLTLLVLLALAIGIVVAWRAGMRRGKRTASAAAPAPLRPAAIASPPRAAPELPTPNPPSSESADAGITAERARLVRSLEAEAAALRRALISADAETVRLRALAADRRELFQELAQARSDTARYRQLVVDLEDNALPPLLDGPNAPDDLKLIVGVGPVLERMLQQLGITTYRQIARWTERDIDDFDARLPEFPGRIRRDTWVIQARALHHSKFGETLTPR